MGYATWSALSGAGTAPFSKVAKRKQVVRKYPLILRLKRVGNSRFTWVFTLGRREICSASCDYASLDAAKADVADFIRTVQVDEFYVSGAGRAKR